MPEIFKDHYIQSLLEVTSQVILDIDSTHDSQQRSVFNGCNDQSLHEPMLVSDGNVQSYAVGIL